MTWLTWVSARPDGELIAIGDEAGRLRVWSPSEARIVARPELGARVLRAEWSADGARLLAAASGDDHLYVLAADGSRVEAKLPTGHGSVAGLSVHPSRPWATTTGPDKYARVWDLGAAPPKVVHAITEPAQGTVTAMSEKYFAAGWSNGAFVVWDLESGKELAGGGKVFGSYLAALAFSPDGGSMIAGGGSGGLIEIKTASWERGNAWTSTPPKPIATNAIAFGPDGAFVCAHSDDTASFFASPRASLPSSMGHAFYLDRHPWDQKYIVSGACFVPRSPIILTSHFTGVLRVWENRGAFRMPRAGVTFDDSDIPKLDDPEILDAAAWWAKTSGRKAKKAKEAEPCTHCGAPATDPTAACPFCGTMRKP